MNTFLKTIMTVFLLVSISFAFASAAHAMTFDQHLITGTDPNGYSGCTTPPAKTAFSPTDTRVYSWLFTSNAFFADVVTWKWYAPDNSLYVSYSYSPGKMGSACIWGNMNISGQPAASKTGTWKVEIYSGSTLAATDTFTIGNPLCTYTYSAWGPCQSDGTQERTITSSSPAGCIEWLPQLTQSCTYIPPALSAPKNLRYILLDNVLTINWDAVAGATGYKLGLGVQSGKYDNVKDFGNIVQIGPAELRTVPPGTYTYYLAVKAYSGSQESAYSNEIILSITVSGTGIEAPKNLRYSTQGNMMTILWDAVSGANGYKIGIGVQSGSYLGPFDLGKATQLGPFDASAVSGTYYLAAKAYKGNDESAYSNELVIPFGSPSYTLSIEQKNLIATSGKPQYLSIVFNSDPERREETWTYTALGKMYLFWDGVQVGEQKITVDPTLYAKPPSVDPSLFAKNTKPYDVIKIFGNYYTVTDASSLDPKLATLDFKTYYFKDNGVLASFIGETLAVVQTNDIPVKSAAGIGQMGQNLVAWENSEAYSHLKQQQAKLTPSQVVALAIFIGITAKGFDIPNTIDPGQAPDNLVFCIFKSADYCSKALAEIKKLIGTEQATELASLGFFTMMNAAELASLAEANCNETPSALDSDKLTEAGKGAVITCPCTSYIYSAWSACQPDGTRTRTVISKSPAGCKGDPAPDLLSQSCPYTKPCTSFTYSAWSACQPNGTRTRTVTSKSPSGCTGDPAPDLLTESCTYTPTCTSYTYTDSVCVPDSYWNGRLGIITRTYKGVPDGCVGNVPPPEYFCCDGLDPC